MREHMSLHIQIYMCMYYSLWKFSQISALTSNQQLGDIWIEVRRQPFSSNLAKWDEAIGSINTELHTSIQVYIRVYIYIKYLCWYIMYVLSSVNILAALNREEKCVKEEGWASLNKIAFEDYFL